jgi:hypothetical protein
MVNIIVVCGSQTEPGVNGMIQRPFIFFNMGRPPVDEVAALLRNHFRQVLAGINGIREIIAFFDLLRHTHIRIIQFF